MVINGRQLYAESAHDSFPAHRRAPLVVTTVDNPQIVTVWHPALGPVQQVPEQDEDNELQQALMQPQHVHCGAQNIQNDQEERERSQFTNHKIFIKTR